MCSLCVSLTGDHASCGSCRLGVCECSLCVSLSGNHALCGSCRLGACVLSVSPVRRPCFAHAYLWLQLFQNSICCLVQTLRASRLLSCVCMCVCEAKLALTPIQSLARSSYDKQRAFITERKQWTEAVV